MWRAIVFYWKCIKEAFRGSFEKANAWGNLIGVAAAAIVAYYWGYELRLPDTLWEYFAYGLMFLVAAWVVVFPWRLIGAPVRLYARLEDEKSDLETRVRALELQRAMLTLDGPHLHNDPRFKKKNHWRMNIHNGGPATARDVRIRLKGGAPGPLDSNWTGDYPYSVYPVGTITNDPGYIAAIGRQINIDGDERYEITCGWKSANGGKFFTDINTKGGGNNNIQINSDERWKLSYEVTAENASPISFVLELFIEDDEIKVANVT